jgi:signal transduction histidine kinase
MTRRIVLVFLALITAVLAVLAVPLGLLTAGQDRADFQDQTTAAATTLASIAEERISDGARGTALDRSVRLLARRGDRVAVYDAAGREIASAGGPLGPGQRQPGPASVASRVRLSGDRLVATEPVIADSGASAIGTVALSRSTEPLEHRVAVLWTLIAAVSAGGLLVAAMVAAGLARWASRPLTVLADAARQLGGGDLDTRAQVSSGPPEVRRLSVTFNAMAARLQAVVHGHQSMMAEVSHQVRTPLAALRLRLDLLAEDADESSAADLTGAQEEVARLSRLVNGMLAVARAENVIPAGVRISVDTVVRDRAAAWRPAVEERGATLSTAGGEPVSAQAGEGHLEQILDNLLANALDAVPPGGTIQVEAAVAGGRARVMVTDDGPGMNEQQKQTAFRRFATSKPGGTGLGLAIVDRLAVTNGGSAALSDTPGGGLTVVIELPLASSSRNNRRPGPASTGDPGEIDRF